MALAAPVLVGMMLTGCCACTSEVFVDEVLDFLVVGVAVAGGHEGFF